MPTEAAPPVPITSPGHRAIKLARSLARKKYRQQEGAFLAEGLHLVEEALEAGLKIRFVFWTPRMWYSEEGGSLDRKLARAGAVRYRLEEGLFKGLSQTEAPQGLLAVVEKPAYNWLEVLQAARMILVVDGVQDPGNLGSMVRTAAAAGADAVFLQPGTVDFYNDKALRASVGAAFRMPVLEEVPAGDFLPALENTGLKVVVADLRGNLSPYQVDLSTPLALVVGNENRGPEQAWRERGEVVKIPLLRGVESLNVAVAAGVILFEALRQRKL